MDDTQIELQAETPVDETNQSEANEPEVTEGETPEAEETETEAKTEDDTSEEVKEEQEPDDKPKKRSGLSRMKDRIAELTAENERLKAVAPKSANPSDVSAMIEAEIGAAPKESDYSDYLAYDRAATAYELDKRQTEREISKRLQAVEASEKTLAETTVAVFRERADQFAKATPDFIKTMQEAAQRNASNQEHAIDTLVLQSEKGPELAYYLAKNPSVEAELRRLSPLQAAKEIGRLEDRVSLPSPKTQSKAPPPVSKVTGGATPPADPQLAEINAFIKRTYGSAG